jgi:16S rRNA (adenine1518-N6/adenine1519-N6)-dimethyltransferase
MMFLESGLPIDCITVMVQKEVADRMQAKPNTKDYGALSVAVQYYAKPEILAKVPAGMFMPAPNVDSAVISLKIYEEKPYQAKNEQLFFRVVKASFGQRRKTLLNALASGLSLPKDQIKDLLQRAEIQENRRGETLSIEEFIRIADLLED